MIIPPYLQKGNTIGITCPAGAVHLEEMQFMFSQLQSWGFNVKIGKTIGTSFNKFSATDDDRIADLQAMLDDDSIDAIFFGRGGYGVVRIIDQIDFAKFKQKPKWLLGYSDITVFHSHLNSQLKISSIHAHMGGGYKPNDYDAMSTQSIFDVVTGTPIQYEIATHKMNRVGVGEGELVGGNLALLSDLVGTKSDIHTQGKILFIEDIGEYKYNIDRMLWQLLRAGKLENLAGLIVGGFADTQDNEVTFGMTEYEIVWEKVKDFSYPVCFDFPVGHQAKNVALKVGVQYQLNVQENNVVFKEVYH
jgi:muramoyltetrapeptide carboxypeptidase